MHQVLVLHLLFTYTLLTQLNYINNNKIFIDNKSIATLLHKVLVEIKLDLFLGKLITSIIL